MYAIKNILVVIDPSLIDAESSPLLSVQRAAAYAKGLDCRLRLLGCVYDDSLVDALLTPDHVLHDMRSGLLNNTSELLESIADPLRATGVKVDTEACFDDPLSDAVIRSVQRSEPDLVVRTSRHDDEYRIGLFSNSDWTLARECPAPVLFAKPNPSEGECILAAVDPIHSEAKDSGVDKQILAVAQSLSQFTALPLYAFHAYHVMSTAAAISHQDPLAVVPNAVDLEAEGIAEKQQQHRIQRLCEIASTAGLPDAQIITRQGSMISELENLVAEKKVSAIVMGALSRSKIARLVLGSHVEKVLSAVTCDVIVVKPPGFATPVETTENNMSVVKKDPADKLSGS